MLLLFYFLHKYHNFIHLSQIILLALQRLNSPKCEEIHTFFVLMVRTLHFVGVSDLLLSDLPAGRAPRMATQCNVLLLPVDMVLSAASINS